MKFIFDLDGTLSFDGVTIAANINAAITDLILVGNEVIFASARPIRDLLPMIPRFKDNKLIGANGAMISANNEVKVVSKIEMKHFDLLQQLIKQYELDYIIDSSWNYSSRLTQPSLIDDMIDPAQLAHNIQIDQITDPIKTILVNLDKQVQKELQKIIQAETDLEVIGLAGEGTLDITAKGINKFSTLDLLGVDKYIAFGNDSNDLEMLSHAEQSVWIESKPSLKQFGEQADVVCQPNSEAVATLIRRYI